MKSLAAYRKRRRTARNVEENDASTQTQTSNVSINENDETSEMQPSTSNNPNSNDNVNENDGDEDPEYCNDDELLELIRRRQDYRIMLVFFYYNKIFTQAF